MVAKLRIGRRLFPGRVEFGEGRGRHVEKVGGLPNVHLWRHIVILGPDFRNNLHTKLWLIDIDESA